MNAVTPRFSHINPDNKQYPTLACLSGRGLSIAEQVKKNVSASGHWLGMWCCLQIRGTCLTFISWYRMWYYLLYALHENMTIIKVNFLCCLFHSRFASFKWMYERALNGIPITSASSEILDGPQIQVLSRSPNIHLVISVSLKTVDVVTFHSGSSNRPYEPTVSTVYIISYLRRA